MDLLVYGFSRGPGELPEIMNVAVGRLHLKFRGVAEHPSFAGFDAILLPFDPYRSWAQAGTPEIAAWQRHAHAEIDRAVEAGALVSFLTDGRLDADDAEPGEGTERSLGEMTLAELGMTATPLPGPEDRHEILVAAFQDYLLRFGITESCFESRLPVAGVRPICRTPERRLTGFAVRRGRGSLAFLPGDPLNRFLEFFACLGEAIDRDRPGAPTPEFTFTLERPLLEQRVEQARRLHEVDRDLDRFRRRREQLAVAAANPARRLPEWFASFLGVELLATPDDAVFTLTIPGAAAPAATLLGVVAGESEIEAVAELLADHRRERQESGDPLAATRPLLLLLNGTLISAAAALAESSDCRAADASRDVCVDGGAASPLRGARLLTPFDLLSILDAQDRQGEGTAAQLLIQLITRPEEMVEAPAPAPARGSIPLAAAEAAPDSVLPDPPGRTASKRS